MSKVKLLFFWSIMTQALLINCSMPKKIATLQPEPDTASPLVYENIPSNINLPISVQLKDIENKTNTSLSGLLYEDTQIDDDNIEMKIWKLAPITIASSEEETNNKITTVLPLKIWIKYRIGTKTLGVSLYSYKEFNFNGVVTLRSEVSMNNWKLNTKTTLQSLTWNESPTMVLFGKKIAVTYIVTPAIKLFKSKIEAKIDAAIDKAMDFKPQVWATLEKIATPIKMSEEYESWLQITPVAIYSTDITLQKESFVMQMGMKCTMATVIGTKPTHKLDTSKISILQGTLPSQITANIAGVSSFDQASKIMTRNFVGQEFGTGTKKIKVQKVAIWHKNNNLVVALDVTGAVIGRLYLIGKPSYNEQKKEIYFDDLDYALDTKNKIMRTANWLAQGIILNKIKQECRYSIGSNINDARQKLTTFLNNYSPITGVVINGKITNFDFKKIQITDKAILAFIKINGNATITIDGLE